MDQELLREYRTLHTLQRALEDAGKAADYLSRRLEQAGFRITGQGTAVLAIRDSALPGPAIGFGARLEMQDTPSGAAHTEGNDAACAMALTAAIRGGVAAFPRPGFLSVLGWTGDAGLFFTGSGGNLPFFGSVWESRALGGVGRARTASF